MMLKLLTEHSRRRVSAAEAPDFPGLSVEWDREGFSLRAGGQIGLFPGTVGGQPSLAVVYPKGMRGETSAAARTESLRRFFQLWMLAQGLSPTRASDASRWAMRQNLTPQQSFPYFLAVAYARVLRALCQRDFRRAYLLHSETLTGRVRGRLSRQQHFSNALRGRGHHLPCTWEEFTADNWDNRILKAAMMHLIRQGVREGLPSMQLFSPIRRAFQEVSDVPIDRRTFARARLGRLSSHYRSALELAAVVLFGGEAEAGRSLRGDQRRRHEGQALRISTHDTFERFCRRIVGEAVAPLGLAGHLKPSLAPLLSSSSHSIEPDLAVQEEGGPFRALGDAKYKRVVRALEEEPMLGESVERIQALAIQTSDQYQMFSYLRLERCPLGFFMIPFWDASREKVARCDELRFRRSPLDGEAPHTVRVVALNLMQPPAEVLAEAAAVVRGWFTTS